MNNQLNADPQPNCEHEYEAVDAGPYSDDIFYVVCKKCHREKPADPQGGESNMEHLYKCSGGHLFLAEENDIETGCNARISSNLARAVNGTERCGLMGWHEYDVCRCKPERGKQSSLDGAIDELRDIAADADYEPDSFTFQPLWTALRAEGATTQPTPASAPIFKDYDPPLVVTRVFKDGCEFKEEVCTTKSANSDTMNRTNARTAVGAASAETATAQNTSETTQATTNTTEFPEAELDITDDGRVHIALPAQPVPSADERVGCKHGVHGAFICLECEKGEPNPAPSAGSKPQEEASAAERLPHIGCTVRDPIQLDVSREAAGIIADGLIRQIEYLEGRKSRNSESAADMSVKIAKTVLGYIGMRCQYEPQEVGGEPVELIIGINIYEDKEFPEASIVADDCRDMADIQLSLKRVGTRWEVSNSSISQPVADGGGTKDADLTYFLRLSEHKLDQRLQGQYTNEQILGMLLKLSREILLKHQIEALDSQTESPKSVADGGGLPHHKYQTTGSHKETELMRQLASSQEALRVARELLQFYRKQHLIGHYGNYPCETCKKVDSLLSPEGSSR